MNGEHFSQYTTTIPLEVTRSGSSSGYIVYKNLSGHTPVIKHRSTGNWHGIQIKAEYIRIEGITVKGIADTLNLTNAQTDAAAGNPSPIYNGNGISVDGRGMSNKPRHIIINNCDTLDCSGGGISVIEADYVTVENCDVKRCCFYSRYGQSGISIFHSQDTDTNTVDYKVSLLYNRIEGCKQLIPWEATGTIPDGHGIIIDDNKNTQISGTPYAGYTLIAGNVTWNNGGAGIKSYSSKNLDIFHNTCYKDGSSSTVTQVGISCGNTDNVRAYNNIIWAYDNKNVNAGSNNTSITYDYNLYWRTQSGLSPQYQGSNDAIADPLFVNASSGDFQLQSGSPGLATAVNSTIIYAQGYLPRKLGRVADKGAYEQWTPPRANFIL